MRTAEVEVNTTAAFRANDVEYNEFKEACKANGQILASVFRQLMRDYVKREKRKKS